MKLDFSDKWSIILASPRGAEDRPSELAAAELGAILGRMGCRPPARGDEGETERIIVMQAGSAGSGGRRLSSWRASPDRVEIYGSDGAALLRGTYDFLEALGARWPAPGTEGERLPAGPVLDLEPSSRSTNSGALPAVLALGHGAFLERYEAYLRWAARAGYSSVLIRVTRNELALEGAPASLYESLRTGIANLAGELGIVLELGGETLGAAAQGDPGASGGGSPAGRFAEYATTHPEISVFHLWPEGPWSFGRGPKSEPAAMRLAEARMFAEELSRARPEASLSLFAYEEDENLPEAVLEAGALPENLGLLWAPRRRSWGRALGDSASSLNAASLSLFKKTAAAWRRAGGGRILALERYEDAFLFKGAAPPLSAVIEGDLEAYRGPAEAKGTDAIGVLCGGSRLPLGLRPNPAILASLAAVPELKAESAFDDWAAASYGADAPAMRDYWCELEAAWAVDLDIEEAESEARAPASLPLAASDPPIDWGDPRKADAPRLAARRERCEELFDHLRRAEARLAEARPGAEADEYAIAGSVLELDCARLAAYHELAAGDAHAAADIANLALSAAAALRKALSRLPDKRTRRETRLMVDLFYGLALREMRRYNARSAVRRLADLWSSRARIALAARRASRAYEPGRKHPHQP
jgi:hypothetical protein